MFNYSNKRRKLFLEHWYEVAFLSFFENSSENHAGKFIAKRFPKISVGNAENLLIKKLSFSWHSNFFRYENSFLIVEQINNSCSFFLICKTLETCRKRMRKESWKYYERTRRKHFDVFLTRFNSSSKRLRTDNFVKSLQLFWFWDVGYQVVSKGT